MRKLLVANRGEIACRIMRSANAMEIATVAVYSEADKESAHVASADEAVLIGPPPARESYLDIPRVLQAARESGANMVHPGYGFLSESAEFAEAVLNAGLIWVGPSPEMIRLMGDKQTARETAARAGVPVVTGSPRLGAGRIDGLAEAADKVGFPLLVKAAAGGGGIGMRRVDQAGALEETVSSVQSAALKAFGNADVYLERFIERSRHVEVQVFGFGDGRATHLLERDCSLQRRFQKVIEEAPAPGVPEAALRRMYDAAIALCREVKYEGAGTVEFILDAESFEFFFLEMNTRIQVEHPVTEMITGIDLVDMQLRQALGLELAGLDDLRRNGTSLECRLYAENPAKHFFPSPGSLKKFALPPNASDLRVDTGYREGDAVTPFYDPLIAKIVARGATREATIERAIEALHAVDVEGIVTNRDFLIACLDHTAFQDGAVHTRFIDEHLKELTANAASRYRKSA